MNKTTAAGMPPYPRLGELYRVFAGALDTKARDRNVDRAAREGEYDWALPRTLLKTLITDPLSDASDHDFADLVTKFVGHLQNRYLQLVADVPLDALTRDDALPLLIEHYFAPEGAALLLGLRKAFDGPDLMVLLDPERRPMAVVVDCFETQIGRDLAKAAFPESIGTDRQDRDLIARWVGGAQLPDLQSIKRFVRALSSHNDSINAKQIANLRRWMIVTRTLTWLEERSPVLFRRFMVRTLMLGLPDSDIRQRLSDANIKAGEERLSALTMPVLVLSEDLNRTRPKAPGDMDRTLEKLEEIERLFDANDPEGHARYHLEWLRGRWHVLAGDFATALVHYEEAVKLANYRAGCNQKSIIEETLALAALVGSRKPLIKSLKHCAVAFGLFESPKDGDVVEDWEIDHLRQQFNRIFPSEGRFPEASDLDGAPMHLPFIALDEKALAELEPDLRKPDRVRTLRARDGQTRRWPQLRLFASIGKFDAVQALLEHGAPVDQLDEAGASALLCAIQYAEARGDRRVLDLLLKEEHDKSSLDSITQRRRHTPLLLAVDYGEPDVVERLLAMGATTDRRGQIDDLTPLYRCVCGLGAILNPRKLHQHLRQALLADPDRGMREVHRRYNIEWGGVFGDEHSLTERLKDRRSQDIFEKLIGVLVAEKSKRISEPKSLRMVELLLKAGANPNARHAYPTPGRTPLMLAAEFDSVQALELMLRFGGDPRLKDDDGRNCAHIAYDFAGRKVVDYMRRNRII